MTGNEIISGLRFLIQEDTAGFFGATEVSNVLNLKLKKWANYLRGTNFFMNTTTITIASGERTEALPSDCDGHVYCIQDESSGDVFFPVRFIRHDPTDTGTPRWFDVMDNTIYFDRDATSELSLTLYYYRNPTAIAATDVEIDFPPSCQEIILFDAAIMCKIRDGADIGDLVAERNEMRAHLHQWALNNINTPRGVDMYGEMMNDGY